jgi:cobalt-zinc-cadmium efflux system outer membrane protein
MNSRTIRWFFAVGIICGFVNLEAKGQAPTLGPELPQGPPGSNGSMLGATPGSGGGTFASPAVGGGQILGGRPGTATPRVPTSISTPGAGGNPLAPPSMPAIPAVVPLTQVPQYGTLDLPAASEYGPPDGLTFDQALELMLQENLDLRARRVEIPSARADVITAGLRGNPIFYADGQLIPYGGYSLKRPGGPLQNDVNISQPLDLSHKRTARLAVATKTLKAVELQYQDAVRVQISNLSVAYVGVMSARETLRYAEAGFQGLNRVLDATRKLQKFSDRSLGDVLLLEAQRASAEVGIMDAREGLRKAKLALGSYLNLPPLQAESIEILAALKPVEPPIPPGEELASIALSCRPDVMAYRVGVDVARASLDLQYKNRYADAYLLYQPYTFQNLQYYPGTHSATSWALGITVPLPVWNRNQGNIERARLNIDQSIIQLRAVERLALEQVRDAEMEYVKTRQYLESLDRNVIPKARNSMEIAERLYLLGESPNITSYLIVQKQYNDIVRQYRDTAVRHLRSIYALNTAVGTRVLP